MTVRTIAGAALLGVLLTAGAAPAQERPAAAPAHDEALAGAFEALPAGDRRIAEALFFAQRPVGEREVWSLDRLAAAKRDGLDWETVLRRLRVGGLVGGDSLEQLVSGYARTNARTASSAPVIVTTATGRTVIVHPRGEAR